MRIEIDLSKTSHLSSIGEGELIQVAALAKLTRKVESALAFARMDSGSRVSNVFFVNGTRGAGKTTFIRTAAERLTDSSKKDESLSRGKLTTLLQIDPSLIETGEHVFFTILHSLRDIVNRKLISSVSGEEKCKYEEWRHSLQRLAKGANVLAHRPITEFADDYLNLDLGLDRAGSGVRLEKEFHELINKAAEIVNTDAFLICFDDVDTEFKEGWKILEIIRRYLQTSRLIVLITGDLQLYTHLVRGRQFENFGQLLHERDSGRNSERAQLVDHLEQQYLLKLFPLQNRIELLPLSRLSVDSKYSDDEGQEKYYIRHQRFTNRHGGLTVPLNELVLEVVIHGFNVTDKRNAVSYHSYLLGLPVRALIQILRVYCESDVENKPSVLAQALRGTLLGSLYQAGIDVDGLAFHDQSKLIEAVFDVVRRDGEFDTGSYLRPQPSDETLRNAFVCLAAEVAAQCYRRPDRAIRYMLQAPGSLALAHLNSPTKNSEEIEVFFTTFKKEFSIGRNEDALNWARYAAPALLSPYRDNDGVGPGVLKLSGKRSKVFGTASGLPNIQKVAFQLARHHVMARSNRTYLSIFNILGAVERLLILQSSRTELLAEEVRSVLLRLMSTVTISSPSWLAGREGGDGAVVDDEGAARIDVSKERAVQAVLPSISEWVMTYSKNAENFSPSSLMLGKIWTRLYFSLGRAQAAIRKQNFGAGTAMHIYTMCLVNAFLVEEYDYGASAAPLVGRAPISRTNPVISTQTVFRKINLVKEAGISMSKVLPFTNLILTCPLIEAFLATTDELSKSTRFNERSTIFAGREEQHDDLSAGLVKLNTEHILGSRYNADEKI
jgi:hypothetical protein